ncbi:lamin tail domain-containing protein [Paraliomyxa miuraensis]|uniref:lamin tail domain-containing protein n=1 Tax=Paraliomyxa miuraensis TaxID=376150 RepID=UPI002251F8D0|nr:lamin tail domain-containing protein [Paraliomyxa miuraensis]MCX4245247.1 lamin tail domain-containing protein [Paraliomyxa miuraensis]
MTAHRPHRPLQTLITWGSLLAIAGCAGGDGEGCGGSGDGDTDGNGDCNGGLLLPGDLVISEIMADAPGADSGREWFEIYNASSNEIDLAGTTLILSKEDGTSAKAHLIARSWVLGPQEYGVVGALLDDETVLAVVPYVDYGYADDLGDMSNTAGRLAIACGDETIDDVLYGEPTQAASRIYSGDRLPDALGNDDLDLWCDSTTALDAESKGTPGERNDLCVGSGPIACIDPDTGEAREAVAPAVGDLLISEIMSDPSDDDDGKEWFEVYTMADFDLNGVAVGKKLDLTDATPVALNDCVPVAAGTRLVFGQDLDPALNGGLPRVDALFDFSINQDNGQLVLSYQGTMLDEYAYGTTDTGVAWNLDPDFHTAADNDVRGFSCDANTPYGNGDLGTPGEANVECAIVPPEGQCFDGGSLREVILPSDGDLVITEVLPNPDAAADEDGEWIEILATGSFDLSGLPLGRVDGSDDDVVETLGGACTTLSAGDYAVIARNADPTVNGALPQVHGIFDFSLRNNDEGVWIGGSVEAPVDAITWSSSTTGAATQLDPAATDPAANDDEANFCPATEAYGDGDLGTPGEENVGCGTIPSGTCLDGGAERDVVPPQPGDLVLTELMPDPAAVGDTSGEWFEVLATASVDLNGLQFGDDPSSPDGTLPVGGDCIAVGAGERVVIARSADPMVNGGLPAALQGSFSLTNGGGTLSVGLGNMAFDTVTWNGSTPGAAWTLDPAAEDPVSNDDPMSWCVATDPYGAGDRGTPGAQGPACGMMTGDGMCLQGGVPRAIVSPMAGDLVITEWMPNPDVVTDANGEWFEVHVGANVDLNDVQLHRATDAAGPFTVQTTITSADCLPVTAGSFVVFARNLDPMINGGLPAADHVFTFGLNNTDAGIGVGVADVILDQVVYATSTAGAATQLDPGSLTPAGNDVPGNLCVATTPYSVDNDGTPGAANPPC